MKTTTVLLCALNKYYFVEEKTSMTIIREKKKATIESVYTTIKRGDQLIEHQRKARGAHSATLYIAQDHNIRADAVSRYKRRTKGVALLKANEY